MLSLTLKYSNNSKGIKNSLLSSKINTHWVLSQLIFLITHPFFTLTEEHDVNKNNTIKYFIYPKSSPQSLHDISGSDPEL